MSTEGLRKCSNCGVWFSPDPRNFYHQHFCSKPECQEVSKRASQQKWCRKNPSYWRGEQQVKRVQAWRREHPGYWRRTRSGAGATAQLALQDVLPSQPVDEQVVSILRNRLTEEIFRPLQDVLLAQRHAFVGLAAMISGEALQEDIAAVLTSCYERGQRIGGIVPWMRTQEVSHERTRTDSSGASAKDSTAIQLGGSSSGP